MLEQRLPLPIEQITKYQFGVLTKLASSRTKTYCCVFLPDQLDTEFNETLRLIELKLLIDISDRHAELVKKYSKNGGDAIVAAITNKGQWMFERTKWGKRIN